MIFLIYFLFTATVSGITSECPDKYFVAEKNDMSKPSFPDEDRIVKKEICCKLTENSGFWAQEAWLDECLFLKTGLYKAIWIGDGVIDPGSRLFIVAFQGWNRALSSLDKKISRALKIITALVNWQNRSIFLSNITTIIVIMKRRTTWPHLMYTTARGVRFWQGMKESRKIRFGFMPKELLSH